MGLLGRGLFLFFRSSVLEEFGMYSVLSLTSVMVDNGRSSPSWRFDSCLARDAVGDTNVLVTDCDCSNKMSAAAPPHSLLCCSLYECALPGASC